MSLRFRADGTFRVLQMADIQDGPDISPDTITLIAAAIRKADPDLVVLTGDQIRGYDPAYIRTFLRRRGDRIGEHVRAVTKFEARWHGMAHEIDPSIPDTSIEDRERELLDDARSKVRRTFAAFLSPIVEADVPFAATYGNHDFQCGILNDEQDDMYREFPGCLNPKVEANSNGETHKTTPLAIEPGTFAMPVKSANGERIAMSIMMVNSGDYADKPSNTNPSYAAYAVGSRGLDLADSDGYGTPSPQAVQWLADVQQTLGEMNGDNKPVPSIAFQHIAPQEFYDCLREVPAWTPNAVEGSRTFAGHCYVLDENVCQPDGMLGESIGCADENVGQVEAMREAGGYFALYCGHDHKNAFVGHVHGMDLGYAPTCGFTSYGPKSRLRGIRLFEFREDNPASYRTRMLNWGELVGRYSANEVRVFFEDHCVTDAAGVRNELRRPQVFLTLSAIFAGAVAGIVHAARALHKWSHAKQHAKSRLMRRKQ